MQKVLVDLSNRTGTIKPMHAVNNGPIPGSSVRGSKNAAYFQNAHIPYVRNHDASFCASYGGEHAVDVENIFRDFDADENDPANYDFTLTDWYSKGIQDAGAAILYRLGSKIEHEPKKYHTNVPRDFAKYARVCAQIIRHLCYGWADGLHLDIPYWEIWNEPDCMNPDGSNPCWSGTEEQFSEFYRVMACHLKAEFPELKIGGPAFCTVGDGKMAHIERFMANMQAHHVPIDFLSFHCYTADAAEAAHCTELMRALAVQYGYSDAELILNEWNYVCGWLGEQWVESLQTERNEKGMAFVAATMLSCQRSPLDMLMYYDARVGCSMNGLFEQLTGKPLPPYYALWQFGQLYRLQNEVLSKTDGDTLFVGAAQKDGEAAVQLAYYSDQPLPDEQVEIRLQGMRGRTEVTCLLADAAHANVPIRKDIFTTEAGSIFLTLRPYSSLLLQLRSVCAD